MSGHEERKRALSFKGLTYGHMGTSRTAPERPTHVEVGPVELKVLSCLRGGLSNRAICDEIGIEADALKAMTRAVLKRLGARDREDYLVAREEFGYRWDRGTIWRERVIDFAGKTGLGWGFLQFAIPI